MSFYVILPSNSSMDIFPDNVQSEYTTILSTPIVFTRPYEVALVDMAYCTKLAPETKIKVELKNFIFRNPWSTSKIKFDFKPGKNDSKERISNDLNELILKTAITDEFNQFNDVMVLPSRLLNLQIQFIGQKKYAVKVKNDNSHKDYALFFEEFSLEAEGRKFYQEDRVVYDGFTQVKNNYFLITKENNEEEYIFYDKITLEDLNQKEQYISKTLHNLKEEKLFELVYNDSMTHLKIMHQNVQLKVLDLFETMDIKTANSYSKYAYVYSDIIEDQYVGDVMAKCLKTCILKNDNNLLFENTFVNPHYLKVCKTFISSIKIDIRDTNGERIKFNNNSTQTIIKLHFKPIE